MIPHTEQWRRVAEEPMTDAEIDHLLSIACGCSYCQVRLQLIGRIQHARVAPDDATVERIRTLAMESDSSTFALDCLRLIARIERDEAVKPL